jgi:hypothetical protein
VNYDWFAARTSLDPDTDCLVWKGCCTNSGQPSARITYGFRQAKTAAVRRIAWRVWHDGRAIVMPKMWAAIGARCHELCVNPAHMHLTRRWAHKEPISVLHRLRIAEGRKRCSKVSDETIREIIESQEKAQYVSRRIGMSDSYASKVRRGHTRALSRNSFGHWSGLLR